MKVTTVLGRTESPGAVATVPAPVGSTLTVIVLFTAKTEGGMNAAKLTIIRRDSKHAIVDRT